MKTSKMQLLTGALVLAALLGVSGVSQAFCGSSQRVTYSDAVCLDAGWENIKSNCFWGICRFHSTFWATNLCSRRVIVKIDIRNLTDKTWYLNFGGHGRTGSAEEHVRGIYCCKDISAVNHCRTN